MTTSMQQLEDHSGMFNQFFLNAPPYEPDWFFTTGDLVNEMADLHEGDEITPGSMTLPLSTQECPAYCSIGIRVTRGGTAGASPIVTGRIVGLSPFGNKIIDTFRVISARGAEALAGESFDAGAIIVTARAFSRVDRIIIDSISANNGDRMEIGYCFPYHAPHVVASTTPRGGVDRGNYGADGCVAAIPHFPGEWEREGIPGIRLICDTTDANAAQLADEDLIYVSDEQRTLIFEIDDDSSVTAGNIAVFIGAAPTAQSIRDAIVAAINAQNTWFVAEVDTVNSADLGGLIVNGGGEDFLVETFRPLTGLVPNTNVKDWFTGTDMDRVIALQVSGIAMGALKGNYVNQPGDLIEIDDGDGNVVVFEFHAGAGVDVGNTAVLIGVTPPTTTATNLATEINSSALTCFAQDVGTAAGIVRLRGASSRLRVSVFSANHHTKFSWSKAGKPRPLGGPLEGSWYSLEMNRVGSFAAPGVGQPFKAAVSEDLRLNPLPFGLKAETVQETPQINGFQNHVIDNTAAGEASKVYVCGQTLGWFGVLRNRRHPSQQYVNHERIVSPGHRYLQGKRFGEHQTHVEAGATAGRVTWEAPSQDDGHLVL